MIKKKPITKQELKEAIIVSLEGDNKIVSLYDPNETVKTIKDVAENIYKKLTEVEGCEYNGVFYRGTLIGYFVRWDKMLLSFSLAVEYRKRSFLNCFFALIRKDFGKEFFCRLWTKNGRAIRWLTKNGAVEVHQQDNITHLIYKKN